MSHETKDEIEIRKKIDRDSFPDRPRSANAAVPATFENFAFMLEQCGITVRFNVIKKRIDVKIPGFNPSHQNRDEAILANLESIAVRHGMSTANIRRYLLTLADQNPYDPFADWINSTPWDGKSRLPDLLATIKPTEDYPLPLAHTLMEKWLLSMVAATFHGRGFRARGVLTLQGAQGLGKTTWIARLVTGPVLREDIVKLGFSWDGGNKDARLGAIRHRVVEIGELEGSFRKEVASLKAFITETTDKIRPPYGRVEAEYPRTTIFAASVNDPQFLIDGTGNSRFWTISVEALDYEHDIDMQQVFAELKVRYDAGAQWWLTPEEEAALEAVNSRHRVRSSIEERLAEEFDLDRKGEPDLPLLTARQVLAAIGYERPTNRDFKDANVALRNLLGPSRRSQGHNRWPVPWAEEGASSRPYDPAKDEY